MNTSLIGAWDFDKFPIYPFEIHPCDMKQTREKLLSQFSPVPCTVNVLRVTVLSPNLIEFETEDSRTPAQFEVPFETIAPYLKLQVTRQSRAVYASLRQREEDRVVKTIEDQCYAALRRIASNHKKSDSESGTLSEIDSGYYKAVLVKPQTLGSVTGVPMAVFHRLMAAGKVKINEDGLVVPTSNGEKHETD